MFESITVVMAAAMRYENSQQIRLLSKFTFSLIGFLTRKSMVR